MMDGRTLAIETAGRFCSLALFDDGKVLASVHEELGRGHAEYLLPAIAGLPGGGRADTILVDTGPGSFTGVRIGYAVARGLGLAWGSTVRGFSSLALVDAVARSVEPCWQSQDRACVIEGGHGQWFAACFDKDVTAPGDVRSLPPADAVAWIGARPVAGNRAADLEALRGGGVAVSVETDARFAGFVPTAAIDSIAYGRPADAKPLTPGTGCRI